MGRNNTDSSCDLSGGIAMQVHPRTLRRAREQVRLMVIDGVSTQTIKNYLHRFALWWAKTSSTWSYRSLLQSLIHSCWSKSLRALLVGLFHPLLPGVELHSELESVRFGIGA